MRPRSPIEIMIDRATGYDPATAPPPKPRVTLKCTNCGKTKDVVKEKSDPDGTARIETLCPDCMTGDRAELHYFNAKGEWFDGEKFRYGKVT